MFAFLEEGLHYGDDALVRPRDAAEHPEDEDETVSNHCPRRHLRQVVAHHELDYRGEEQRQGCATDGTHQGDEQAEVRDGFGQHD